MATEEQQNTEEQVEKAENTGADAQENGAEAKSETTDNVSEAEVTSENEDTSNAEMQKLQAQYDEMKDKYLRLNADFENFRRHSAREKMDILNNVKVDFVKNMLPVIDDFERAMVHIGEATDVDALREGVELIYRKFGEFLTRSGIEVLDPKGADFNADEHEAVAKMPAPTPDAKGKVYDCVEKGYKLNEKFIRYPKVVVSE